MHENGKRLIVVLGMHRSGTSAITRSLKVLGVTLGDRLMPSFEDINDKGFWEDIDLNALNIEMMNAIDSDWYYLSTLENIAVENLHKQGYFLRAVEMLRQKVCGPYIFGFKDPRVAKLLPFWKGVFSHCQVDVSYVIVIRHPLSVAMSLDKRDGIEPERSYLMWLGHVIPSLSYSVGDKRVIVDYDCLMQSPEREISRIAKALHLEIDLKELKTFISDFLDEKLRHTEYKSIDLLNNDLCPPLVREIYTFLLEIASDKVKSDDPDLNELVARWSREFDRFKSTLSLVDKLVIQIGFLSQFISEKNGQHNSALEVKEKKAAHIRKLEADWKARGQHVTELEQIITDQVTRTREIEADWAARGSHIESLEQIIAEQNIHICNVEADWVARGSHIETIEHVVNDQAKHIYNIETELEKLKSSWYRKFNSGIGKIHRFITSMNRQ
jgi:hypothetical protein